MVQWSRSARSSTRCSSLGGQQITVGQLLLVPVVVLAGFLLARWGERVVSRIGVGFGAQNIINNFISGWILMWERPIRIT